MTRRQGVAAAFLTGPVLLASALVPSLAAGPVTCLFRLLTGLPCPTCGMTHAFVALGHGDAARAVEWNAASPLVFAACVSVFALGLAQAASGQRLLDRFSRRVRLPLIPVAAAAFTSAWAVNLVRHFAR